ncbi:MAG TPA: hypothetical protein VKU00_29440, partial [Chthonomonadaceae bacterium]|nr:hypothetical protein [Chthonomonadaceae bacterium]
KALDPHYDLPAVETFAHALQERFARTLETARQHSETQAPIGQVVLHAHPLPVQSAENGDGVDAFALYKQQAIQALQANTKAMEQLKAQGILWSRIMFILRDALPSTLDERDDVAYQLVREALNHTLGEQSWETFKDGAGKTMVRVRSLADL